MTSKTATKPASQPQQTIIPVPEQPPNLEAPTGEEPRRKVPQRGTRRRVLGEGEGDYCIYEIAPNGSGLPAGSLVPLPTIPRFTSTVEAVRWIRLKSGDLLAGKQLMVLRALEIMHVQVQQAPQVVISAKPKITVTNPKAGETSSNG